MTSGLARLAKLERENVELNEEVLKLKNQLLALKMAGTPPGSPSNGDVDKALVELRQEILHAVSELKKFRKASDAEKFKQTPFSRGWNNNEDLDLEDLLN
jgi:hypothetical protein